MLMGEYALYVSLPKYTVLLVVKDRIIVEAPPIARWTVGRVWFGVLRYFRSQPDCEVELID